MLPYLIKRLSLAMITLFIILLVSYCLIRLAPGDPTKSTVIGEASTEMSADKSELAVNKSLREKLYLDRPILVGFFFWLKNIILHGDFGDSASVDKGRPVMSIIAERIPITLTLNILSIIVVYLFAIPLGIYSAVSTNVKLDKGITFILFLLYSIPTFWMALVLQASLCKGGYYPIFPLKGISPGNTWELSIWEIEWKRLLHLFLPVLCLSYGGFAGISRYARIGMLEVVNQDYIRTARAKGLPESVVILKHALRNALIVLITLFAGLLPGLIAGSIFIEHVFSIPGMGSLSMDALTSRDIPILMALFGIGGALTLAGILVADLLYVLVDPRISFEGKR